jgi:heme/copper-type cytochrome/quinol oxidase subunit 1
VFPTVEVGNDAVVYVPDVDGPSSLLNILNAVGNALVALTVLLFVGLAARSFLKGERAGDDPWNGQTLEWATTSPAPADNFAEIHVVKSAEPLLDLKSSRSDA